MSRKTVYYHDPLHDDFAPTNGRIRPKQIGADFPYEHKGPLWNALAFVVYRMVMTPFLFLYCKLVFGLRIENRKALRALPGGYFLYGNHTNTLADAFIPTLLAFPRRANIITSADTVSIPGVRNIVQMLGAIPLANTIEGTRQFLAAMHRRLERGQAVMIYPEAHIWPYCLPRARAAARRRRGGRLPEKKAAARAAAAHHRRRERPVLSRPSPAAAQRPAGSAQESLYLPVRHRFCAQELCAHRVSPRTGPESSRAMTAPRTQKGGIPLGTLDRSRHPGHVPEAAVRAAV